MPVSGTPRLSAVIFIFLFSSIVGLAGISVLPTLDRDEARFVQATTQMLETGDYINIRFQDAERNKKPAGIHWMQAASVTAFSDAEARAIWAYRLPSYLASLASALLAYLIGCRLFGARTAFYGALLLAAAPSFTGEATIAKTDAVLLTTVLLAQLALARIYLDGFYRGQKVPALSAALFWVALGIGIMIKGPITPMISILTVIALCVAHFPVSQGKLVALWNWLMNFRPITGLVILAIVVGPWATAIGIETQGRFFADALGTDMLGKVNEAQESHSGDIGYYLIFFWIMFWPAGLFLPLALRLLPAVFKNPGVVFCIAWLVPSWIVFEIASTKLPHYTLPLYPAIAFLIANALISATSISPVRNFPLSKALGSLVYLFVIGAVSLGIYYAPVQFSNRAPGLAEILIGGGLILGSLVTVIVFWRSYYKQALVLASLMGGIIAWSLYQYTLPRLERMHMSVAISQTLEELDRHPIKNGAPAVALLGYNEPSAVFHIGTNTRISLPDEAAAWLITEPGRIAVVEKRQEEAFLEAIGETPVKKLATLEGYNYSNAIDVVLTLYISG